MVREQGLTSLRQTIDGTGSLPTAPSGVHDWRLDPGLTAIGTAKRLTRPDNGYPCEFSDYPADGVIVPDPWVGAEATTRRQGIKYRGAKGSHASHKPCVTDRGIDVAEMPGEARSSLTEEAGLR